MILPDQLQAHLLRSLHVPVQQRRRSNAHAHLTGPPTQPQQTCQVFDSLGAFVRLIAEVDS